MKHFLFLSILFSLNSYCIAGKKTNLLEKNLIEIQSAYTKESFSLTKNAVGFSPPVSARAFAYFYLSLYEANKTVFPLRGIDLNKISEYKSLTIEQEIKNKEGFVNSVAYEICNYFYRSMSPFDREKLVKLNEFFQLKFGNLNESDSLQAKKIVQHIIAFSKNDGADEAYLNNYPEDYVAPKCKACWTKSMPGFFPALLPYYGKTRTFISNSNQVIESLKPIEFSIDSSSQIFKESIEIYQFTKNKSKEAELIAEYWDDSPGYSGTPPGHLLEFTQSFFTKNKVNLTTRLNCLLSMSIAMHEAFILCWRVKYNFNFIRPITYIQQYIDPKFNSYLASPSFPEFTSGHSFQSGAAVKVLMYYFPKTKKITDKTNVNRTDIDGKPRSYNGFEEMGKEISLSRFYGGIHFKSTLDVSFDAGKNLADVVLSNLIEK